MFIKRLLTIVHGKRNFRFAMAPPSHTQTQTETHTTLHPNIGVGSRLPHLKGSRDAPQMELAAAGQARRTESKHAAASCLPLKARLQFVLGLSTRELGEQQPWTEVSGC